MTDTLKSRENPMSIRSKNALGTALLKLMISRELEDISIQDITKKAGLSRQTFYTNFREKEDILVYLVGGLFGRYRERLEEARPEADGFLIDYFMFWGESRDFLSLLFRRGKGGIFQEANRHFFEAGGLPKGLISSEGDEEPYVRAGLAGMTYELLYIWMTRDLGLSVSALRGLASRILSGELFRE